MRRARMLERGALACAFALAISASAAVEVERIEVHSRRGEPLVAEIPLTGAGAEDLEALRAQLASPTTFARIGLPRPSGVVADLRFEVVRGPFPRIRVTSGLPVEEEFFTFLLQVDAPQGRVVREYSIALGAEPAMPQAAPPLIEAPVAWASNVVQRAPDPADALPVPFETTSSDASALVADVPPIALSGDRAAPPHARSAAVPLAGERPGALGAASRAAPPPQRKARNSLPATRGEGALDAEAPRPAATASNPRVSTTAPLPRTPQPGDYRVREGDNLSRIARRMELGTVAPAQAMLALLRTNPDAFAAGNINLLRRGAVLRRPGIAELARLEPAEAEAAVRLQVEQWRSGNLPPEPAVVTGAMAAGAPATRAPRATNPSQLPPIPLAAPAGGARLEIVSSSDASPGVGSAGGRGAAAGLPTDAQARAAAEALAVRYTEFQQMRQRVAELEHRQKLLLLANERLAAQPTRASVLPWALSVLAMVVAFVALWRKRRVQTASSEPAAVPRFVAPRTPRNA